MLESNCSATWPQPGPPKKNDTFNDTLKKCSRFLLVYKLPKPDKQNVLYSHQREIFEDNGVLYDVEKDSFGPYPIS